MRLAINPKKEKNRKEKRFLKAKSTGTLFGGTIFPENGQKDEEEEEWVKENSIVDSDENLLCTMQIRIFVLSKIPQSQQLLPTTKKAESVVDNTALIWMDSLVLFYKKKDFVFVFFPALTVCTIFERGK